MAAGKQRRWDMISSHSSVGVIIYHTELDALLVVRQFRPPVSFLFFTPCWAHLLIPSVPLLILPIALLCPTLPCPALLPFHPHQSSASSVVQCYE